MVLCATLPAPTFSTYDTRPARAGVSGSERELGFAAPSSMTPATTPNASVQAFAKRGSQRGTRDVRHRADQHVADDRVVLRRARRRRRDGHRGA